MKTDPLITNSIVVSHAGMFQADLAILGERIVGIFSSSGSLQAEEVIDVRGMLVLPGVIDSPFTPAACSPPAVPSLPSGDRVPQACS